MLAALLAVSLHMAPSARLLPAEDLQVDAIQMELVALHEQVSSNWFYLNGIGMAVGAAALGSGLAVGSGGMALVGTTLLVTWGAVFVLRMIERIGVNARIDRLERVLAMRLAAPSPALRADLETDLPPATRFGR